MNMYTPKPTPSTAVLYRNKKDGWWVLRDLIAEGREFKNSTGSFRGVAGSTGRPWGHVMPASVEQVFTAGREAINYVIYSYETPIAWHISEGDESYWVVPSHRYSLTTSQHQGDARVAVAEQPADAVYGGEIHRF